MTSQQVTFQGYHYRTSSCFGSRVDALFGDEIAAITGPRVPLGPYRLWIGIQAVLLALVVPALVAAAAFWDWRYLALSALLLIAHLTAGGVGAGCMWELMNLIAFGEGKGDTISFPLSEVEDVRIGRGWARRGMWLLLLPYVAGINKMAEGFVVSFIGPTDDAGWTGVYALHMATPEDAQFLAAALRGD